MIMNLEEEFLTKLRERLDQLKHKGDLALSKIDEKHINWKPDKESNSIAIIVKHISGNMLSRWTDFYTSDGEKKWRDRDGEFEGEIRNKEELLTIWNKGWKKFYDILNEIKDEDLLRIIVIYNE